MGTTFSEWIIVQISVLQGFILRPLRFDAFLIDHLKFIINSNVSNFTHGSGLKLHNIFKGYKQEVGNNH